MQDDAQASFNEKNNYILGTVTSRIAVILIHSANRSRKVEGSDVKSKSNEKGFRKKGSRIEAIFEKRQSRKEEN